MFLILGLVGKKIVSSPHHFIGIQTNLAAERQRTDRTKGKEIHHRLKAWVRYDIPSRDCILDGAAQQLDVLRKAYDFASGTFSH
jgi:hypothetical protein